MSDEILPKCDYSTAVFPLSSLQASYSACPSAAILKSLTGICFRFSVGSRALPKACRDGMSGHQSKLSTCTPQAGLHSVGMLFKQLYIIYIYSNTSMAFK